MRQWNMKAKLCLTCFRAYHSLPLMQKRLCLSMSGLQLCGRVSSSLSHSVCVFLMYICIWITEILLCERCFAGRSFIKFMYLLRVSFHYLTHRTKPMPKTIYRNTIKIYIWAWACWWTWTTLRLCQIVYMYIFYSVWGWCVLCRGERTNWFYIIYNVLILSPSTEFHLSILWCGKIQYIWPFYWHKQ